MASLLRGCDVFEEVVDGRDGYVQRFGNGRRLPAEAVHLVNLLVECRRPPPLDSFSRASFGSQARSHPLDLAGAIEIREPTIKERSAIRTRAGRSRETRKGTAPPGDLARPVPDEGLFSLTKNSVGV